MNFRELTRAVDRRYLLFDTTGRLPTAMLPLGMLLHTASVTDSYARAGLVVGALSLGGGIGGPLVGVSADRFGQRPVAVIATVFQVLALAGFLLVEPLSLMLLCAGVVGLTNPQVGAMSRARWAALARRHERRAVLTGYAMAFEGAVDETSFVVGPVLVATLAGLLDPVAALSVAWVLALVTQIGFAVHPSALPRRPGARETHTGRLASWHLAWLLLAMAGVGVVFGVSQAGVAARMDLLGRDELTGLVYAAMGFGSALTGLLTPRFPARIGLATRIWASGVGLVAAGLVLAATSSPTGTALGCLVAGVALAPALISSYSAADRATPPGWGTTVMTSLATANVVGVAVGAAIAGQVIDLRTPAQALLLVLVAGLVVVVGGLGTRATEREATAHSGALTT